MWGPDAVTLGVPNHNVQQVGTEKVWCLQRRAVSPCTCRCVNTLIAGRSWQGAMHGAFRFWHGSFSPGTCLIHSCTSVFSWCPFLRWARYGGIEAIIWMITGRLGTHWHPFAVEQLLAVLHPKKTGLIRGGATAIVCVSTAPVTWLYWTCRFLSRYCS